MGTVILYRPVGPAELRLIEASGWKAFPPRLPEQPIFYPVLNQEYATQIARDWNLKTDGAGYVTRFEVDEAHVSRYPIQTVGASVHKELWVPAEELAEFNAHIIGGIEVVAKFELTRCSLIPHCSARAPADSGRVRMCQIDQRHLARVSQRFTAKLGRPALAAPDVADTRPGTCWPRTKVPLAPVAPTTFVKHSASACHRRTIGTPA